MWYLHVLNDSLLHYLKGMALPHVQDFLRVPQQVLRDVRLLVRRVALTQDLEGRI